MQQDQRDVAPHSAVLTRAVVQTAALLLALSIYVSLVDVHGLPLDFFAAQDRYVVLACLLAYAGFALFGSRVPQRVALPAFNGPVIILVAGLLTLLLWAGTYLLLGNHAFTRDEQMVLFDVAVFRKGLLAASLAPEWREFQPAMAPFFTLPFAQNTAWVSAYLPGNAALRTAFSLILEPALMNPLLAGLGAVLLHRIACRLFPDNGTARTVALLIYLTSSQMIATAMTPFAMTGHMTLNLLWLALFLKGGRLGHGGAAATGFLATGLHQVIFHPLFIVPFLEYLRRKGEWRTAIFYIAVYAVAGLFWISYPGIVEASVQNMAQVAPGAGAGPMAFVAERVLPLLLNRDEAVLALTGFNLLRFATWQNLALIPLFLCALPLARRNVGIAQPLYFGIILTVAAMIILLPYQGVGWGYRYVHGLLGSFALLAGYGWQRVENEQGGRFFVAAATVITLFGTMPYLLSQMRGFVRPSVVANQAIARVNADFVVVDTDGLGFAMDQVRNDPFLRNRPLRFSSRHLDLGDIDTLCARGSLAFVSREQMRAFGLVPEDPSLERRFPGLRDRAGPACARARVDAPAPL